MRLSIILILFSFHFTLSAQDNEFSTFNKFATYYANFRQGKIIKFGIAVGNGYFQDSKNYFSDYLFYEESLSRVEIEERYDRGNYIENGLALNIIIGKRIKRFEIGIPIEFNWMGSSISSSIGTTFETLNVIQIGSGIDAEIHQAIKRQGKSTIFFGYNLGANYTTINSQSSITLRNKISLGLSLNNNKFNIKPYLAYSHSSMNNSFSMYGNNYDLTNWLVMIGVKFGVII